MGHKINWTNENEKLKNVFSLLMGAGQGWTSLDKFGQVLTSLNEFVQGTKMPSCMPRHTPN